MMQSWAAVASAGEVVFARQGPGREAPRLPSRARLPSDLLLLLVDVHSVPTVVISLDFLLDLLHVLDAGIPGLLRHLGLLVEPSEIGLAVAAAEAIPEGGELAVVVAVRVTSAIVTSAQGRWRWRRRR